MIFVIVTLKTWQLHVAVLTSTHKLLNNFKVLNSSKVKHLDFNIFFFYQSVPLKLQKYRYGGPCQFVDSLMANTVVYNTSANQIIA